MAAEAYAPLLDEGLVLALGVPGVPGVAGLVLEGVFALVLGLVEVEVPRWNDDWLPWPP